MVGVQAKQEAVVVVAAAALVDFRQVAAHKNGQAAGKARVPFFVRHFLAAWRKPHDVLNLSSTDLPSLEKIGPAKGRMSMPKMDQPLCEPAQLLFLRGPLPPQPTDLVVLTISIVISLLRSAVLVPCVE